MTTRVTDILRAPDTLANRPAATAVPAGTLYSATDTALIYRSDGTTWSTWAVLSSGARTINAQTGTSYTLALTDATNTKFLTLSNATAVTLTVPTNATVAFPIGSIIALAQLGAGQVTISPAVGVTVNAVPGLKIAAQYGVAELLKTGTDTWLAYGRLSA